MVVVVALVIVIVMVLVRVATMVRLIVVLWVLLESPPDSLVVRVVLVNLGTFE